MTNTSNNSRGRKNTIEDQVGQESGTVKTTHLSSLTSPIANAQINTDQTTRGQTSIEESPSDVITYLNDKHIELAHEAVTYLVTRTERSGKNVEMIPVEPAEEHYLSFSQDSDFQAGELYRVWYRTNTEVHLSTFLILSIKGANMTCLKIVHRDPKNGGAYKFEKAHGRLKAEKDMPGTYHHSIRARLKNQERDADEDDSFVVVVAEKQELKENCWIDLNNPWNVDWRNNYRFVYCGTLDDNSFGRVVKRHRELYLGNLPAT
jgi:hypothetical protein